MSGLLRAHQANAWVMVLGNAVVGTWALAAHRWPVLRRTALWWATGLAEVAVVVQVFLGVAVMRVDDLPAPEMHQLYGYSALVAIGIVYGYRSQLADRRYLLFGLGGLFIMGLGIRAMFLA